MESERLCDIATALVSGHAMERLIAVALVTQSGGLQKLFRQLLPGGANKHERGHGDLDVSLDEFRSSLPLAQMRLLALEGNTILSEDDGRLIEASLNDPSALCREHACLVVASVGSIEPSLGNELISRMGDSDRYVRAAAAFAVRRIGLDAQRATSLTSEGDRFFRLVLHATSASANANSETTNTFDAQGLSNGEAARVLANHVTTLLKSKSLSHAQRQALGVTRIEALHMAKPAMEAKQWSRELGLALATQPQADRAVALTHLLAAHQAGDRSPRVVLQLSLSLMCQGDVKAALDAVRGSMMRCLDYDAHLENYLTVLQLLGKMVAEFKALEQRIANASIWDELTPYAYARMAIVLGRTGRARRLLAQMTARPHAQMQSIHLAIAQIALETGQMTQARVFLDRAEIGRMPRLHAMISAEIEAEQALVQRVHLRNYRAPQSHVSPKRVAVLLSGFLRSYRFAYDIANWIEAQQGFEVHLFFAIFDRLGDLRIPEGFPSDFSDYGHGGYYREVRKTAPVFAARVRALFQPTDFSVSKRRADEHYRSRIGMAHPQWLKLYEAWCLLDGYRQSSGMHFDHVIRARFDMDYTSVDLCRLAGQAKPGHVVVPSNHVFGSEPYRICDRFAFGGSAEMKVYCELGNGRNFVTMEAESDWIQRRFGAEASHETHLAYWLEKRGIGVISDPLLHI